MQNLSEWNTAGPLNCPFPKKVLSKNCRKRMRVSLILNLMENPFSAGLRTVQNYWCVLVWDMIK